MISRGSLVFCVALLVWVSATGAETSDLLVGPYLQNLKPDAVTILWETVSPAIGKVVYGEETLQYSQADVRSATLHEITLKELRPGVRYKYRCAWANEISEAAQFTTAPPDGTRECRIVLYGDSRSNPEIHTDLANLIAREEPDLVLNTGDLVAQGTEYDQWKPQFFDPIHPHASSIPWFTVPGNHERESAHYYNYVSLPGNESWWSTDYANVHLIGLDSCLDAEEGSEQYRWLEEDLRNNRQEWTIVAFHHPLFNAHPTRSMPSYRWAWQNLFQEYGVDLAVSGHDHYYHRTYPIGRVRPEPGRGVVHITTGGGGASVYPTTERPYSAYRRSCHHFVLLDVGGDRIVGRTINRDGKGIDAFVLDKESVPSPEEFVSYEALALESRLRRAATDPAPVAAKGRKCNVEFRLESETDFQVPVILTGRWRGGTSWSVEPFSFQLKLRPGENLAIPVAAESRSDEVYPLPALELTMAVDTAGQAYTDPQIGFRNGATELHPLRVWIPEQAKPRKIKREPVVDGSLDESDWDRAFVIDRFLTNEGVEFLGKPTEVRLMTSKTELFVGARVRQDPLQLGELPYTSRDNTRLDRVENIGVYLWNGKYVYQFIISAAGDVLDMRGGDVGWNCDVLAATEIGADGWTAEVSIPLEEMAREAPENGEWKVNVSRKDGVTGRRGEWQPLFSERTTDPVQFAELKL